MPRKSRKRSADKPVEDLNEEVGSPSNRSRVDEESVKQEAESPPASQESVKEEYDDDEVEPADEGQQEDEGQTQGEEGGTLTPKEEDDEMDQPEDEEEVADEDPEQTDDGNDEAEGDEEEAAGHDNEEMEEEEQGEESLNIRKVNVEGRPAEAGIITKVVVINFMCHQKLTVNLCRNVNFIHGQNGSGKSAILAAIQICLGANAKRTHRARNLKDLVRKEAAGSNPNTTAKVSVTLLNGGEDAYKPDLYGSTITVERTINLKGGFNGYKLFDEAGKEVSRRKADLDDMLDYLNIQVDNPVAILDQEEAKKFLTGKASDKYNFFMKATELERIDKAFQAIEERSDELDGQKQRLQDSLESKMLLAKTLKKKVDEFQQVELLERKLLEAQVDYSWAFFEEVNAEYEESVQKKEAFDLKVEAKLKELTQAEEDASGASDVDEEKKIRDTMEELGNEAQSQAKLKRDLEAERKLAINPVKLANRKLKTLEGEKRNAGKSLIQAQKRLKEAREEMAAKEGSAESEQARRTALLNETEEALNRAKAEKPKIHEAVSRAHLAYEEHEQGHLQQAKESTSQIARQVHGVKSKLRELSESNASDPAAIFGRKCSDMVKAVAQARKNRLFKEDVIGPIGVFLKIAPGKEKYADIAEATIGNSTLDRFIVTNAHDRKQFDNLRRQVGCKGECNTFQQKKSQRFNVPPPPAPEIETLASVLSISNDDVFNCLVDNLRIDQRALAPSKEISEQHLLQEENGRYKIKGNIVEVMCLPHGDKWQIRSGNISMSSSNKKGSKKIGVDRTQAIKETEAELRNLERELKELKTREKEVHTQHIELKREWNEKNKARRANIDEITKLTAKKRGDSK